MFPGTPDRKELGRYALAGQVGVEMVAPIAGGVALDHYLGWAPWGVVVGAALGLVVGVTHLVYLTSRPESPDDARHGPEES